MICPARDLPIEAPDVELDLPDEAAEIVAALLLDVVDAAEQQVGTRDQVERNPKA